MKNVQDGILAAGLICFAILIIGGAWLLMVGR